MFIYLSIYDKNLQATSSLHNDSANGLVIS